MDPASQLALAIQGGEDILIYKRLTVAAFTILYFDYFLTLPREIKLFWRHKKAAMSIVFFFNRYYPLFGSMIISLMMFHPTFRVASSEACKHIALFLPVGWAIMTWIAAGLLLTARVYAFYSQSRRLGLFLLTYLGFIVVMMIVPYVLAGAGPLPIPDIPLDPYHACIELESPLIGRGSVTWVLLLCGFDTLIMTLVLIRVWKEQQIFGPATSRMSFRSGNVTATGLVNILLRDGVLYFIVVFSMNFTFMMMVLVARPGRQYIMGTPAAVTSVVMANRITINLREEVFQARRKSALAGMNLSDLPIAAKRGPGPAGTPGGDRKLHSYPPQQHYSGTDSSTNQSQSQSGGTLSVESIRGSPSYGFGSRSPLDEHKPKIAFRV